MPSPPAEMQKKSEVAFRQTVMRGHTKSVQCVKHLPGGQRMITCSDDGSLRLWNLESGAQIGRDWRDKGYTAGVRTIALSPRGGVVASGSQDGAVRLWDVETGKVIAKWTGHATVPSVCWSSDGQRLVSGSDDGIIRVWDVKSGTRVRGLNPIKTGHKEVYAVSYSPNATKIATGGFESNKSGIKIWDAKTGKKLATIKDPWIVWTLAWTSDEKKLISGSGNLENGWIRIFDTATWQELAVLPGHERLVSAITLSPNERLLASASWDKTVRLWNLDTNLPVGPPIEHEERAFGAAFSSDGKFLATACDDRNAYVCDIHGTLKAAGLEDLLSIPDVPKYELKHKVDAPSHTSSRIEHSQDIDDKSFLEADATRGPDQCDDAHEFLPGFFDDTQDDVYTSATRGPHPHFSAFLGRISSLFHRSRPNTDAETQLQQPPVPLESHPHAFLAHLSSLIHRSRPDNDEANELQQPLTPSGFRALLGRLSPILPHSQLDTDSATELQQPRMPSGSHSDALIDRLSSLFRSPPDTNESIKLPQCQRHTTSSRCSPYVVEVAAMRDKQALYVARRPETAAEKARRIKDPSPWVRVVLFLCCVSPGTNDTRHST